MRGEDSASDLPAILKCPRGGMDITFGFGPKIPGSNPGEGTHGILESWEFESFIVRQIKTSHFISRFLFFVK